MKLKYLRFFFFLLSVFFLNNNVFADGNSLLMSCLEAEKCLNNNDCSRPRVGLCLGYLQGVKDTITLQGMYQKDSKLVCFPEGGISNRQTLHIVLNYLKNHPELLHKDDVILVWLAIAKAFPCE